MARTLHAGTIALCALATTCAAQTWPAKPIRIINTKTAGVKPE